MPISENWNRCSTAKNKTEGKNNRMGVSISVIVPVYKVEEYIHDCVDSILAQTFRDFELILVDDGSPDNCGKICDEYARLDDRIIVIHQENKGISGARNAGLDIAAGNFVTFIDSDDVVNPRYLNVLLDAMTEDVDITVCKFLHFDNSSELDMHRERRNATYTCYDSGSIVTALFNGIISIGAWGKLYRMDIIGNSRFPVGKVHEDTVFTPTVCYAAKKTVYLDQALYCYRVHHNSITHKKFTVKRYDAIWAIDECIRYFDAEGKVDIVNAAKRYRTYTKVTYAIYAWRDNVKVPREYRVNLFSAVLQLRQLTTDDYFEYYLAQIHPKLAVAHEYLRKIKSLLPSGKRKRQ